MAHPLVEQLWFARAEWQRGLDGVTEEEGRRRILPMNCLSWMVGHLAWQEQRYWVEAAQGRSVALHLEALVGSGQPASRPSLREMWQVWEEVTVAADAFLATLAEAQMGTFMRYRGVVLSESIGTKLQRVLYHYWYHTGEALAVRQLLGHDGLPEFVGDLGEQAPYRRG